MNTLHSNTEIGAAQAVMVSIAQIAERPCYDLALFNLFSFLSTEKLA